MCFDLHLILVYCNMFWKILYSNVARFKIYFQPNLRRRNILLIGLGSMHCLWVNSIVDSVLFYETQYFVRRWDRRRGGREGGRKTGLLALHRAYR